MEQGFSSIMQLSPKLESLSVWLLRRCQTRVPLWLAREVQSERFRKHKGVSTNAAMSAKLVREHCALDATSTSYLEHAMESMNFSARAHDRILKVARTIADLAGCEKIQSEHILEAIQYRSLDRKLFG